MISICKCGCGDPIPPGRKTYAGPRCHGRWRHSLHKHNFIRTTLFERDGGICSICACDTMQIRRDYTRRLIMRLCGELPHIMDQLHPEMRPAGFPSLRHSWWQADHEEPLIEGGSVDVTNCRTVCVPCHKKETARLAARLAEKRRAGATLELPLCL